MQKRRASLPVGPRIISRLAEEKIYLYLILKTRKCLNIIGRSEGSCLNSLAFPCFQFFKRESIKNIIFLKTCSSCNINPKSYHIHIIGTVGIRVYDQFYTHLPCLSDILLI